MRSFLLASLIVFASVAHSQKKIDTIAVKNHIDSINRLLDRSVVKKDLPVLEKHYADDFFFLHATGKIDSKATWMKSVSNPDNKMLSREHDTVKVELHPEFALVSGTLTVKFPPNTRLGYAVRYIRIYAQRKNIWQLVSHHSTAEWRDAE